MVAVSLHTLIFVLLLGLIAAGLLAISLDRWRFRDGLLKKSGAEPAQLAQALEGAPFGLALLEGGNHFVYINRYAQRLMDNPGWQTAFTQDVATVQTRGVYETVYRQLNLSDGQTMSWWVCPLPRLNLVVLTDLTAQRRLHKSSQEFLGTLSHELRTPLTAVLAHLDIARKQTLDEPTRQESLTIAHQEMHRLAQLVQEMVQLSRLEMSEEIEKRPCDLLMVAETAVTQLLLNAEAKGIAISLEAAAPLPLISGDAAKLKQLFLNVIDNSVKYGRAGDQITICLMPKAGGTHVTIQDTGPGIPPEHLPHVTERLYRAHKDTNGSGLGLAIAAEILRLHQSRLEIESPGMNVETGTTVSFLLPAK